MSVDESATQHPNPPAAPADRRAACNAIAALIDQGMPEEANARLATLLQTDPLDPTLRRLQARATIDTATAIQRWHALRQAHPDDPQSHLDLAHAVRQRLQDPHMADAVLDAALQHLPDHLAILQAMVEAAAARDDAALVAACERLLAAHPTHTPTATRLADALERLGHQDALADLLRRQSDLNPADPTPLLRLATLSEPRPLLALQHYATLRARHPDMPEPHLGLARMLNTLERGDEADDILVSARRRLPNNVAIGLAWAQQALQNASPPAAADRAAILRAEAPDLPDAPLLEADALLQAHRPEPALALLETATRRFPDHFPLAELHVQALNRLGRWHDAARGGRALVQRFGHEPSACIEFAAALVRLGRVREAEAALREARDRCPGHTWMSTQLARLAQDRGAADEALVWWRDAGLPGLGSDSDRRHYALALAQQGDPAAALALVRTTLRASERPWLRLAEAELLATSGQLAQARALWSALSARFSQGDPAFAALTWRLAAGLALPDALPLLQALLAEPDRPEPDWRPAIARFLAGTDRQDPIHDRLLAALAEPGPDTTARALAESLAGPERDADALAQRVLRAVHDARQDLVAILLENADQPARTARLRIALRLAVNRLVPTEAAFAALDPARIATLLLIARVFDTDSLDYVASLARPRFPAASLPNLTHPADTVGCLVHRMLPPERRILPGDPAATLRVALCLHGHAPRFPSTQDPRDALALQDHDVSLFAHLWSDTAGPVPGPLAVLATLPAGVQSALAALCDRHGLAAIVSLYPDLFALADEAPKLTSDDARERYRPSALVIENQALPNLAEQTPSWLRRYKVRLAHGLAVQSGRSFDLVLHVAADAVPTLAQDTDWRRLARDARAGVVFADTALQFRRGSILSMGETLVAGAPADMLLAAESFTTAALVASGQARIAGLAGPDIQRHSLPVMLHLKGIQVAPWPVRPQAPRDAPLLAPVAPDVALARLWACLKRRPPAEPDSLLVRTLAAEVTGGIKP